MNEVSAPPQPPSRSAHASPVPLYDTRHMAFFHFMFSRFFRKHMRAVRVARWGLPDPRCAGRPLVVFANHPGWWDGVAFMLLARALFPGRQIYTPMDARALERYRFMRRIGVFAVETGTPRGAVAFLRTAKEVLASTERMLWMNAPGRFSDVRERPVPVAPGMTRLPEMAPDAVFLPLALDYPFWTERKAEMLCAFGPPIEGAELVALHRDDRQVRLSRALGDTLDRLVEDAIARDPARFDTLLRGPEGMGGVYQLWNRVRSTFRGERFDPRHDPRHEAPHAASRAAPPRRDPHRETD